MRFAQLRAYALSLPEVSEEPHFNLGSFRVKGKIFMTLPPGNSSAHVFVDDQHRDLALTLYPEAFEPLEWGKKIVGVRVDLARVKPAFMRELVLSAWLRKTPKQLVSSAKARV